MEVAGKSPASRLFWNVEEIPEIGRVLMGKQCLKRQVVRALPDVCLLVWQISITKKYLGNFSNAKHKNNALQCGIEN